ncbi:MAG: type II secretion system F family protein [Gammaproteobacteria bacterium TMED112]|nr:MAG: type II secretion system F family protein [Gammaproteobacteria bacterium TMED112]
MATYKYNAFDANEKIFKGYVNATDKDEAKLILKNRGLNALKIEKSQQKRSSITISNNNLSIFTKQMSALLGAGTPIEKCLLLLSKQSSNNKFSQILLSINEDITEGNSLSSAMKKYPSIFDDIYTSTIYAGETSASLSEVFHDLSIYLDKEAKVRSQVIGALIYPAVLFIVSIAVIYALLSFVLPQVVEQFVSSNVELPLLTRTLLTFSDIFPIIIGSLLLIFISIYVIQITNILSKKFQLQISKYFLFIPLIGPIILYDQTARFCSSMRLMTKAGLNTIDSLQIAQNTFKNKYLRSHVERIVNKVIAGTSISKAFSQANIFPEVFQQLLSSGDMGSQVSEMFEKTKEFLDQEVDTRRNLLLTLLQPIVILTMGVFVMLIVLSIMLPLLQMNNLIFTI